MPEGQTTPPAGASDTPPAGDTTPPSAPAAGTTTPPAGADELAVARSELAQARKDAAGYRERLKAIEDKDKSDTEKLTERATTAEGRVAELEAEVRAGRVQRAAFAAAQKQGFWDPEVGASLVNPADIQFDDAGNPKNMDALIGAIAKAKPRLVNGQAGNPDYGAGQRGGPATGADMNHLIRVAAGRGG